MKYLTVVPVLGRLLYLSANITPVWKRTNAIAYFVLPSLTKKIIILSPGIAFRHVPDLDDALVGGHNLEPIS